MYMEAGGDQAPVSRVEQTAYAQANTNTGPTPTTTKTTDEHAEET